MTKSQLGFPKQGKHLSYNQSNDFHTVLLGLLYKNLPICWWRTLKKFNSAQFLLPIFKSETRIKITFNCCLVARLLCLWLHVHVMTDYDVARPHIGYAFKSHKLSDGNKVSAPEMLFIIMVIISPILKPDLGIYSLEVSPG